MVQTAMMDIEFKKLKELLPNVALNTTAANEHVGEIEQKIRVIKERPEEHSTHCLTRNFQS